MIAKCPKCGQQFATYAKYVRGRAFRCRVCGTWSQMHLFTFTEDPVIYAKPEGFIRASELPRGNFAKGGSS